MLVETQDPCWLLPLNTMTGNTPSPGWGRQYQHRTDSNTALTTGYASDEAEAESFDLVLKFDS